MIETVREIEKSERRGQKNIVFTPIKMIVGNKKDLLSRKVSMQNQIDKQEFQKMEVKRHKLISALTNSGVTEAFSALINDLHSDNLLQKEFFDLDKRKKYAESPSAH
jgi:predicted GTPase